MRAKLTIALSAVAAALLLAPGCGGGGGMDGGHDSGAMVAQAQAVEGHVTGVESDLTVHAAIVTGTSDLEAIAEEEDAHAALVAQHASAMEALVGSIRQCPHLDSATESSMDGMDAQIALMRDECDDHRSLVASATSAEEIAAEEQRHADAMAEITGAMHMSSGQMTNSMGSHACSSGMGGMGMMGGGM